MTTSWKKNNQDGGLFLFILPIIISKHPINKPITKLTRIDRAEEVEICQKRKLRTTDWGLNVLNGKDQQKNEKDDDGDHLALIY